MAHPARRWIVAWCLVLTVESALSRILGLHGTNNLWLSYASLPLTTGMALWGLSHWQASNTPRLALRASIPMVMVVTFVLTITMENTHTFSLVAAPFHSLVLLLAALWLLIHRSVGAGGADGALIEHDWFWVTSGLIVYAGTAAAVQPLGLYLLPKREDLVHAVWTLSSSAWILAFTAIAWGMLCPEPKTSSGGSSPRPSSQSLSSRADS